MIGLSISLCIQEILEGKVKEEDVEWIIAGTSVDNLSGWAPVIKEYSETYWKKDPDEAEQILIRLISKQKILQPRLSGMPAPNISNGIWRR